MRIACAAFALLLAAFPALAQNVKITPIGSHARPRDHFRGPNQRPLSWLFQAAAWRAPCGSTHWIRCDALLPVWGLICPDGLAFVWCEHDRPLITDAAPDCPARPRRGAVRL
jgi:hypothetical protein